MKLAILSREPKSYSTQRLVEAAAGAGPRRPWSSTICSATWCWKRAGPVLFTKVQRLEGFDAIIPRIGASVTFYGTAVVRQFEMMKVRTAIDSQAIVRSRDKLRSMQILSRAGVGMPKTAFTNYSEDVPAMIEQVGGAPVIIKLLEGTQGLGVVLAESAKAAQSVIEAFHNLKARIIVQEFIAESKGADLRAFVVDGEVVGAMKRQGKEGEFRSNLHRGGMRHPRQAQPRRKSRRPAGHQSPGPGHCGRRHAAKQARPAGAGSKFLARPGRHRKSHPAGHCRPHHRIHRGAGQPKKSESAQAKKPPRRPWMRSRTCPPASSRKNGGG